MAHTLPDYSMKYKSGVKKVFIDLAEVASRLGGLSTWDRQGNIVWYDDFEAATIHWIRAVSNGSLTLSTEECMRGEQSLKFYCDAVIGAHQYVDHPFEAADTPLIGIELAHHPMMYTGTFDLKFTIYTGAIRYICGWRYTRDTGTWSYWDNAGAWTDLVPVKFLSSYAHAWHHIKLVVNQDTGYYERLIVSEVEYDLSAIPMQTAANATTAQTYLRIRMDCQQAADPDYAYVDDVVYTMNEPANGTY